ncbi:chorismate synthase [Acetomicrobium sp. S15 = DSM 107314]|jgi:chorismate synthase|uniref:chorismate synthase n=1 Tax=Acetomicrobium sp. S15 = DSM 107314 TaxID=2529858 RepID=UPI0022B7805B|nr:chorismate synthase [Acetomicrobium sp. S15 = DSM 107314]
MTALRFLTSGESHGLGYLIVVEGLPAGLEVRLDRVKEELARRRRGFGRGERMRIERDLLEIWGGVRDGVTTGAPVGLALKNSEWELWKSALDPQKIEKEEAESKKITRPRPGHADLSGAIKYSHRDMRNVLERASARVTAAWTVAGTLGRLLLELLGVEVRGAVTSIGGVCVAPPQSESEWAFARNSSMGSPRPEDEELLERVVRSAMERGDSVGGTFVISAVGLPPGIGSYVEWDRRLDGRLAAALMAIPAIKGVEAGDGFSLADRLGSEVHDEILLRDGGLARATNRAGGLEGGMTNGEEVVVRAAMKPIPTIKNPLRTVDIETGMVMTAHAERSDTCAVPAACVVGEAMAAWTLAVAVLEQFGGDTVDELKSRFTLYRERAKGFLDG